MIWDYVFYVVLILGTVIVWIAAPVIVVRLGSRADLGMQVFYLSGLRIVFACGGCLVVVLPYLVPLEGDHLWEEPHWPERLIGTVGTIALLFIPYLMGSGTLAVAMYRRLYHSNHPEDASDPERPSVEAHIRRWRWLCRLIYRDRES